MNLPLEDWSHPHGIAPTFDGFLHAVPRLDDEGPYPVRGVVRTALLDLPLCVSQSLVDEQGEHYAPRSLCCRCSPSYEVRSPDEGTPPVGRT